MDHEALMQRLQFQGNNTVNPNGRKRTSDESDDSNSSAKRFGDGSRQPSKLQEKNKMLASLLANPLKTPNAMTHIPPVRIIPDITHNINNINNRLTSSNQTPQLVTPLPLQINNNNNNTINKNSNSMKAQQAKNRQTQSRAANLKPSAENYLNQMPQQQPNPQQMLQNQMHQSSRQLQAASQNMTTGSIQNYQIDSGQYAASSSTNSTPATSSTHQLAQTTDWEDTELNDILDKVIDFVPEGSYSDGDITSLLSFSAIDSSTTSTQPSQSKQQDEIAKIQKIQQSLMEFEGDNNIYSPPAYSLHNLTPQQQNQVLQQRQQQQMASGQCFPQPPPVYTQRNVRLAPQSQLVSNSSASTVVQSTNSQQGSKQQQNAAMMLQQRMQLQRMVQQQHQKERLLQAQQGQQMLVPSNATASAEQLCMYFTSE